MLLVLTPAVRSLMSLSSMGSPRISRCQMEGSPPLWSGKNSAWTHSSPKIFFQTCTASQAEPHAFLFASTHVRMQPFAFLCSTQNLNRGRRGFGQQRHVDLADARTASRLEPFPTQMLDIRLRSRTCVTPLVVSLGVSTGATSSCFTCSVGPVAADAKAQPPYFHKPDKTSAPRVAGTKQTCMRIRRQKN